MKSVLTIALIVCAILLILLILMQNKGVGLSATFGGEGNVYSSKRGAEKIVSRATIVLAVLFMSLALVLPLWERIVAYFS
ncbi:MAG: preprotein translocase subunit SecG [Candidatus Gracilibacteria bacterium]|nr:preprotein translocase subunit SecG [Candidatus Gracilibacteria bacterium]